MTTLTIYQDQALPQVHHETADFGEITSLLAGIGITFQRWQATQALVDDADQEAILKAYDTEVGRLMTEGGYQAADVVRLKKGTPDTAPMRAKFLDEHTHAEDEVRFFVEGTGAFYLRGKGEVYRVICTADDLISVPANQRHWFDMGPHPHFCAIRLFTNPEGWVANFTGYDIAKRVPYFE
ncbi:MAG: 1,2-dihydroxy-3-keto-5-methylthiopentene dioxygenase [Alphaproteobacteria bacterium]|jgi:1,2-dihydroxy-3-keto-5-methylthiopentene dioxygenase